MPRPKSFSTNNLIASTQLDRRTCRWLSPLRVRLRLSLRSVLQRHVDLICYYFENYCNLLLQFTKEIGDEAFSDCNLQEVHIPIGTERVLKDAFDNNNRLSAVYIPPSVIKIGDGKSPSVLGESTFGNKMTRARNDLVIYCVAGSTAMEYARKNNIKCAKAQF